VNEEPAGEVNDEPDGEASGGEPRLRRRRLMRASRRLASRDVQMRLAVLALAHWDRLTVAEQERFRSLAENPRRLQSSEQKELRTLWKRLEIKSLVAEAVRTLTADQAKG
jgi:hypothetical protein